MFRNILDRENAFLDYRKRSQKKKTKNKKQKIGIFQKGLVHGFGQKMGFFALFYFGQNRQEKSLSRYSRKKERLSRL